MAVQDFNYYILDEPSAFTGDPATEGYRSLYTLKCPTLPATFTTPEQITNPNFGSDDFPEYSVLLVANSPATLFQQIDAVVTAEKPGAEDTAAVTAAMTVVFCRGGSSPAYYRSPVPGEGGAYADSTIQFIYELRQIDSDEVYLVRTSTYYHPNAAIQIYRNGAYRDVDVQRRVGMAIMYAPGDIQFQTSLSGFTPSEPWHPNGDTGLGIETVDVYETSGPTLINADQDWTAILAAVGVKQPT